MGGHRPVGRPGQASLRTGPPSRFRKGGLRNLEEEGDQLVASLQSHREPRAALRQPRIRNHGDNTEPVTQPCRGGGKG